MSLLVLVGRLSESILVYGRGIWRKRMMSNIEHLLPFTMISRL